jgi:hypothetical protein
MSNITPIDNRDTNLPKNGWLWVHDYSPKLVELYFLSVAITDWLFWHCAMNQHDPENENDYKFDKRKAAKLIDLVDEILNCGYKSENRLGDLFLEQIYCFPYPLIVKGAVKDNESSSEAASSLFYWPPLGNKEKITLEDYVKMVVSRRSHIFNDGNYHDSINWLDIYDMEIHDAYRGWIVSKETDLYKQIRRKIKLTKTHLAVIKEQAQKQWITEASHLGLAKKQADEHWHCLWEYLSAKISYHRSRFGFIENAMNSEFQPRLVQPNTAKLTQIFGRQVVNFSEARIDLFADVVSQKIFDNVFVLKNFTKR